MSNPEMNIQQKPKRPPEKVNTSGRGKGAKVPPEIAKKFNWGAFFFLEVWGILNKCYLPIVAAVLFPIPILGQLINLGFRIYFGIKGNEIVWQNNYFPNIRVFNETQKRWLHLLLYFVILAIIIIILYSVVLAGIIASFAGLNSMGGVNSMGGASNYNF